MVKIKKLNTTETKIEKSIGDFYLIVITILIKESIKKNCLENQCYE